MRYVRLGRTELEVSAIACGTWAFGGDWGSFDAREAKDAIHRALELGVTFFDTAQAYGFGASERLLGDALRERGGPNGVVLATKGGLRPEGKLLRRDASARWLREGVESSLRNLRTDHVDLYQVHWPDPATPPEETGAALAQLVAAGKIGHVGVSNYDAWQMGELERYVPVETLQPPYHLFRRGIEAEVLPYAAEHRLGVMVYGALAHGLLSGRMTAETTFAPGDWRSHSSDFAGEPFRRNLQVVARLKAFASLRGVSLPQLAIAWALSHPAVHVAIVGARRAAQLDETAAAGALRLSAEDRLEIEWILSDAAPVRGPSPEGM